MVKTRFSTALGLVRDLDALPLLQEQPIMAFRNQRMEVSVRWLPRPRQHMLRAAIAQGLRGESGRQRWEF
jgi:hypothetical protein